MPAENLRWSIRVHRGELTLTINNTRVRDPATVSVELSLQEVLQLRNDLEMATLDVQEFMETEAEVERASECAKREVRERFALARADRAKAKGGTP